MSSVNLTLPEQKRKTPARSLARLVTGKLSVNKMPFGSAQDKPALLEPVPR